MYAKRLPALAAVSLLAASLPHARAAQSPAPDSGVPAGAVTFALTPKAPRWQAKTKAQVVGFRLGAENVFDGVVVFNGADTALTSVRVGCVVEAPNAQTGGGQILGNLLLGVWDDTDVVHVNIPPGATGVVRAPAIPYDAISAILVALLLPARTEVTATLGITRAEWANGRAYRRSPSRGFPERPNRPVEVDFLVVTTSDIDAQVLSIEPFSSGPDPGPARPEVTRACVDAPGWTCVVSTVTGECVGGAMAASALAGSGTCKAFVTAPPAAP